MTIDFIHRPPGVDECQCWGHEDPMTGNFVTVYVCELCSEEE